jgi:hypothetical protein
MSLFEELSYVPAVGFLSGSGASSSKLMITHLVLEHIQRRVAARDRNDRT